MENRKLTQIAPVVCMEPAVSKDGSSFKMNRILDTRSVQHNSWSAKDWSNLKKRRGDRKTVRGSQIIREVVDNLRVRHNYQGIVGGLDAEGRGLSAAELKQMSLEEIYNINYGDTFTAYLKKSKPDMSTLVNMRGSEKYKPILETRSRMADWMIEVLTAFGPDHKSNEYTYFKALTFLDLLISKGIVRDETVHIYGMACMYLASNILDKSPITQNEIYEQVGHRQFKPSHICMRINKATKALDFQFNTPSWVEYLDKVIFDVFGDYRESLHLFTIRQHSTFVLHVCAFDPKFYAWDPFELVSVAIIYAICTFYNNFEENADKVSAMRAEDEKNSIIQEFVNQRNMSKISIVQKTTTLNEFIAKMKKLILTGDDAYRHLSHLFKLQG